MKRILIIAIFLLTPLFAYGQSCPSESQCVPNTVIDASVKAVNELASARQVIEAFKTERGLNEAERASAARLVDRLNGIISTQDKLAVEYDRVILLLKDVIKMQSELVEKMQKMLNAPKSAWSRFVSAIKTIGYVLTGIGIARGL
mgnify:CR=1 FL=1